MKNPDQLIADYLDDALSPSDEVDLNTWLNASDQNMRRFADALQFDQQIRTAAHARQSQPVIKANFARRSWFSRAAAGIGTIPFLNQIAAAAVTKPSAILLMKKAITSVSAIILLAGGCGLYFMHHQNERRRARSEQLANEVQTLSQQLGLKRVSTAASSSGSSAATRPKSAGEMIVILNKKSTSMADDRLKNEVREEIAALDAEALKNLLLDAEKLSNPPDDFLVSLTMKAFIEKDPAEASKTAVLLIGRGSQFQFRLSDATARAFKAWLAKDPAAADAWYVTTAEVNGFDSTAIPPNGLEKMDISRSLARLRFSTQALANPEKAEAMLSSMMEEDTILAMQEIKDPAVVARLLPKLGTEAKARAAEGAIQSLAANDIGRAFAWAGTQDLSPQQRDNLLATGIESAAESGKLDLAGVKEWSQKLSLPEERLSKMQVFSALGASKMPGADEHAVVWDRVQDHCAWLRAEAPAKLASKSVGQYLGLLTNPGNVDKSLQAYEQEAARLGAPDADFTITFASYLGNVQGPQAAKAALKLLEKLPASPERDRAVENINLNR